MCVVGRGSYSCVYKVENVNNGKIYCAKNYYPQVDTTNKSKRYLDVNADEQIVKFPLELE